MEQRQSTHLIFASSIKIIITRMPQGWALSIFIIIMDTCSIQGRSFKFFILFHFLNFNYKQTIANIFSLMQYKILLDHVLSLD